MQKMWLKGEITRNPVIATYQGGSQIERSPNKVALLQLNLGSSLLFDHLKQAVNKYLFSKLPKLV